MRPSKPPPRALLTIVFSILIACILVITMAIAGAVIYFFIHWGILPPIDTSNTFLPIIVFALVSIVAGTIVATILGVVPLKPVRKVIGGLNRLANGDYQARLELGGNPVEKDVADSFNKLADELQNTEMLRSDFVNNFSHEFKTPIVSIRGFAKLLQKGNLTDEQKEYLEIIIEESGRLADMTTQILNLTKVENQNILTDICKFNLSEQIRDSVLLLENKWVTKNIIMHLEFEEYFVEADEEQLKQIWINIVDNAIKFSPENGEIAIDVSQTSNECAISIKNNGPEISAEDRERIFNKYWQGDTSHVSEGTGIGLSIAKRIIELHNGSISVDSSSEETVFVVRLPIEMHERPL